MNDASTVPACPVVDIDFREGRPAFWNYGALNKIRDESAFSWGEVPNGFWMVNRYEHVRAALQMPNVFTNEITNAIGHRRAAARLLPQNLNGQEHTKYRHVVNPWFSPGAIERVMPFARARCAEMLDALVPIGHCDLTVEFAMLFPTEVFLELLGLPVEDGARMLALVEAMFHGFFGGDPADTAIVVAIIKEYYEAAVADRRASPRDPATDFVTHLLRSTIDGEPVPHDDVVTMLFTIMLAGLDTTRSALGYTFQHLATHPIDRARLVAEPQLIPTAVEEFLRLYTLLLQDGRYVAEDIDFHGCPMKQGDVVWLGLASANRDPSVFDRPDEFVIDRESNKHLAFGAGAHRCLGAHLARKELILVLEEWLQRIPDFTLVTTEPLHERGGQLMLTSVPLTWDV